MTYDIFRDDLMKMLGSMAEYIAWAISESSETTAKTLGDILTAMSALKPKDSDPVLDPTEVKNAFAGMEHIFAGSPHISAMIKTIVSSDKADKSTLDEMGKLIKGNTQLSTLVEKNREKIAQAGITLETKKAGHTQAQIMSQQKADNKRLDDTNQAEIRVIDEATKKAAMHREQERLDSVQDRAHKTAMDAHTATERPAEHAHEMSEKGHKLAHQTALDANTIAELAQVLLNKTGVDAQKLTHQSSLDANTIAELAQDLSNKTGVDAQKLAQMIALDAHEIAEKAQELWQQTALDSHTMLEKGQELTHKTAEDAQKITERPVVFAHEMAEKTQTLAHQAAKDAQELAQDAARETQNLAHQTAVDAQHIALLNGTNATMNTMIQGLPQNYRADIISGIINNQKPFDINAYIANNKNASATDISTLLSAVELQKMNQQEVAQAAQDSRAKAAQFGALAALARTINSTTPSDYGRFLGGSRKAKVMQSTLETLQQGMQN